MHMLWFLLKIFLLARSDVGFSSVFCFEGSGRSSPHDSVVKPWLKSQHVKQTSFFL